MKLLIHDLDFTPSSEYKAITGKGKLFPCIGCFNCWTKTPGKCTIRDDYRDMGELFSQCQEIHIISRCVWGGLSTDIKNILDRSIGYLHPFFTIKNNQMHHKMRYPNSFSWTVNFYGSMTENEIVTAKAVARGNAVNFGAYKYEVNFFNSEYKAQKAYI